MSNAMSLKAKIRNIAKQKNIPAQVILQNYMFERLLVRLAASAYTVIFPVGKSQSSDRNILQTITDSSPIIWQSLFVSFARSNLVMRWTSISVSAAILIREIPLLSERWLVAL